MVTLNPYSSIWNENQLTNLGSKALAFGDTTGAHWKGLIPHTIEAPPTNLAVNVESIPAEKLDDYNSYQNLVNHEPIREALNVNPEDVLSAVPIKLGNLEYIDLIIQNSNPRAILASPNLLGRPSSNEIERIFNESQQMMNSVHDSPLRVTPGEYFHDQEKKIAVREMITGHEELNINVINEHVLPRFLTLNPSIEKQNEAITSLPPELKSIFMAYTSAKLIGLRTLMSLSTLNQDSNDIHFYQPKSLTFASGDAMGRITPDGILSLQAVSFPWGTKSLRSIDEITNKIIEQDDAVYLDDGKKGGDRLAIDLQHQIPQAPGMRSWINHIVNWTVASALEHLHHQKNQSVLIEKIGKILKAGETCNTKSVASVKSPYNTGMLESIAVNF